MTTNLLGVQITDVIASVLDDASGDVLLVNPSAAVIQEVIDAASSYDASIPTINVLADESALKEVMDDFLVASEAADLIDTGSLSLRVADTLPQNSLLLSEQRVVALVGVADQVGGLSTEDDSFVTTAYDAYQHDWEDAEEFSLRTPPISRVQQTLSDEISPDAEADFTTVLDSMDTARGDGQGLDEVTISLLVAARNKVLLYDISKWGEDVGLASKATFSRTKTRLEDLGIIDTEKVPIDVGRPRLRLRLADDRLQDAAPSEVASVAQSVLAS